MNMTAVPVGVHPGWIIYYGEGHFAWSWGHVSEASKDVQPGPQRGENRLQRK